MKATDLMIGDWVKPSCWNEQVILVGEGRVTVNSDSYTDDEINPIPLTAEILNKNFRADKQWGENGWFINDHIHIFWESIGVYHIQYMEIVAIEYVHELQHALKLCGIDKEIEL